jgi:hypothetical protein
MLLLAVPFGFAACLDFSPGVGSRPLNDDERAALAEKDDTGTSSFDAATDGAPRTVFFGRDIRPLINRDAVANPDARGCFPCHNSRAAKHVGLDLGGLDLTTLGSLRKGGGTSGTNIVKPGDPKGSAIVQKLRGTYPYGTRMPKNGPPFWSDDEIGLVEQWILEGAQGDDSE